MLRLVLSFFVGGLFPRLLRWFLVFPCFSPFCSDILVSCFAAVRAFFPASRSLFDALLLFPSRLFVGSVARPIECIAAVVHDAARPHPSLSVDIRTVTDSEKTERKNNFSPNIVYNMGFLPLP